MNPRCLRTQIPAWKRTKHYQKKKKMNRRTSGTRKFKMTWLVWEAVCSACKRPWRTRSCSLSSLSCIWPTQPSWNTRRPKPPATSWWVTKQCAPNFLSWKANHGNLQPRHRLSKSQRPPRRWSHSSHSTWTPSLPWYTARRCFHRQQVPKPSLTHFCRMSTLPWCHICRKA